MPRIRQKAQTYAEEDFLREVLSRCAWAGIKNNEALGDALGVSGNTVGNFKRDPGRIRVDILRQMVQKLKLDPFIVLCFLGYTTKDVRKFAKNYVQGGST